MKMKNIRRFLSYMGKSRAYLIISFILGLSFAAASMAIPYFAGRAIDSFTAPGDLLIRILLIIVGLIIIAGISQRMLLRCNNQLTYNAVNELRNDCYKKISRLPMSYLDKVSAGSLQSMIISDTETIADGILLFLNQFVSGLVSILFTLGVMLYLNWRIALIVLIFTPVSFVVSYLIAGGAFKSFRKQSEIRSELTSFMSEMTNNYRECRMLGVTEEKTRDFGMLNDNYRKTATKATFLSSISNPSTRFVNALIYAGIVFVGALTGAAGGITIGALSSLLAYASQFMKPFNDLSAVYTEMSDSMACMSKVFEYLDEKELDEDLLAVEHTEDKSNAKIEIEFRDVTFSYVPGKPVLKNVSFKVGAGQSFAIVGPTGCGKTTLINLLMRFYEPDSGEILVGGKSIKDIPRTSLRDYIGFVSQDTWLHNGTVIDNIRFGAKELSAEEARQAAVKTGSDSFIRKLPDRYDEYIDNNRSEISEGQRQLLTITRAMAANPSIMILDEATSSVDIMTEVRIQKAINELLNGRTGIIIAHRLSTIIGCDMIVVLDKGEVKELGSHSELIGNNGFYSKLYASYTT